MYMEVTEVGIPFRRIPCNLHWKQTNKSRFILFLGYLVLLHVPAEWWKMTWQNMQRLKVNRHRPCLYRHYYLAVGFIVDKPCQTEVFQPIFCSYTAWITKNVRFGTSSSHFFPVSTGRFLICLKYHAHTVNPNPVHSWVLGIDNLAKWQKNMLQLKRFGGFLAINLQILNK